MPPPSPEPLYVLRGHRAAVQCVAFLPNSKALAAGDAEGELKLWDLDSQRPAASIRAHDSTSGILQVACPATPPWVVSQGRDGVVKCWGLHSDSSLSREPVQQLASGSYNFCRFALLQPGQTSSSCCRRPTRHQVQQQHHLGTAAAAAAAASWGMPVPAQAPAQVVVDGFTAAAAAAAKEQGQLGRGVEATGAGDRQQHASAQEGLLSRHLRQQQQQQEADELLQMQIGQQEQLAAEGLSEQLAAAQLQEQQQHRDAGPRSEAAGTAGARAAAGAAAGASAGDLTEAEEEQLMLRNTAATSGRSPAAASNSSSSSSSEGPCYLALPVQDPAQLGIWQLGASGNAQPQVVLTQGKGSGQPERGQCMAVALLQPQGSPLHVLAGYEDGSVALWDTRNSSSCLAAHKLHSEPVMCLAAAADCNSGFSGSADAVLAAFDISIPQGQLRKGPQLPLPQQGLADVAIRPDGRIAATAGWDARVRVWHCRKRQPLAVLKWHSQQVSSVAFSPESVLLAVGGRDNFISMWGLYPPAAAGG